MGIYIKGMEMPKNCAVCRLERDLFGRVVCFGFEDGRALYKDDLPPVGSDERRPSWCPLIEIPIPHGRLIDADKPIALTDSRVRKIEVTVAHIIENNGGTVDVIIPAEEGET